MDEKAGATTTQVISEPDRRDLEVAGKKIQVYVSSASGEPSLLPVPPPPPPITLGSVGAGADGEDEAGYGQSSLSSVFTLCNSAIGAGVLSLPFAFRHAGLLGGAILCLVVGAAEGFTLYVLSKFAERYQASSYGKLVRHTLGKKLAATLGSVMLLYLWGSCVAYLIIIGDTGSKLGALFFEPDHPLCNRHVIILGISALILLPLCLLKRLGHLSSLSALAVAGFLYTSGLVFVEGMKKALERGGPHIWASVPLFKWDMGALFSVGIVVFSFNCHANVVSIFSELITTHDPLFASLPSSPRAFRALQPSLAPRPSTHKLINMLSVVIAQALILMVVIAHYPLNHHPARGGLHDILTLLGCQQPPSWVDPLFTLLFLSTNVALAMVVESLGEALHIIGGTAAAFMIFFLPGLMLINAAVVKNSTALLNIIAQDALHPESIREPLLRLAAEKGIKKTGLIYSPGKSWVAGCLLVGLSICILAITLITTFAKPAHA